VSESAAAAILGITAILPDYFTDRPLDTTPDELVAAYSLRSAWGRNALALGRY